MFRRRRRQDGATDLDVSPDTGPDAGPDMGADAGAEPTASPAPDDATAPAEGGEGPPKAQRPEGPYDAGELDLSAEGVRAELVDLGGLLVRGAEGMTLQMQPDDESGIIPAVLVALEDSAVQLLAVAAPRSSGMWPQARSDMAAEARRQGATVEEADGPFGRELRVVLPVVLPTGEQAVQPSRVVGIDGPRWMLQATFVGRATFDDAAFGRLAEVVRSTVVVRGDAPMAPGDLIPLRLPEGAVPDDAPTPDPPRPTLSDLDPGPTITEIR